MIRLMVTLGMCLFLGAGVMARAAEAAKTVPEAVREGLALFEKGKASEAIQSLQRAIELIQQQQQSGVEAYLPKQLAGWKAGEVEKEQVAGATGVASAALIRVSRTFTREEDGAQLTVSFLNAPQFLFPQREMLTAMKANPTLLQAMNRQGNVKAAFIERDGWTGWQRVDQDAPESQLTLIAEGWLLEVRVGIADKALLELALQAVDLKAITGAAK